eukprot:11178067-Karenia_brevis.AAC.1
MASSTSLHSALLDGVLTMTSSDSEEETAETKFAEFVYDGNAEQFYQWESQTKTLITSVKGEKDFLT